MKTILNHETAMKRAQELLNIDQKPAALKVLHDFITSMWGRTWQKTLELIMFKYVEICVDMRRGMFAKEGLLMYKNVCLQVNVGSLEVVINHLLRLSTERAENAWNQAQALYHDLEPERRPENLMISFVSGENAKDRSEYEIFTPWFKFLWETYTTVLEILHDNSELETLYSKTVFQALNFCKQYKRTTEFCRLCEIIRNHRAELDKYKDQRGRPVFSAPKSLQLYLDTRFEQLHVATELALWQEAFHTVEDIHALMCKAKKTPKTSIMIVYYAKLAEILWVANSPLYHAYAWFKIFTLQRSHNKNMKSNDLKLIACAAVLAALSVVPYDHMCGASRVEFENEKDRNMKMANLIGFGLDHKCGNRKALSRSALLSEIVAEGVIYFASQEVKEIYNLLELECIPLDVGLRVQPLLAKIFKMRGKPSSASSVPEISLAQYVSALEQLTTLRLIQQASKVHQTIKLSVLSEMVPFFDYPSVEKVVVEAIKYKFITMKLNHLKGLAIFGSLDLESDKWRDHLTVLAEQLNKSRSLICPPVKKAIKLGTNLPEQTETTYRELQARKLIIEKRNNENDRVMLEMERKRKEEQENQMMKMEQEEAKKKFFDEVYRMTSEERKQTLKYENLKRKMDIECGKVKKMTQEEVLIYFNVLKPNTRRRRRKPLTDSEVLLKFDRLLHMKAVSRTMGYMESGKDEQDVSLLDEEKNSDSDSEEDMKDFLDLCRREMKEVNTMFYQTEKHDWRKELEDGLIYSLPPGDPISLERNAFSLMERREKKSQNLAKTMDYMVKAKRKEEILLRDDAFLKHFNKEEVIIERGQQQEIEQSQLIHLEEKNRLARMLDKKTIFQDKIARKREAEQDRLMSEKDEVLRIRKKERDTKRKTLFYLKTETERYEKSKAIINEVFEVVERQRQIEMDIKEKAVGQKSHPLHDILESSLVASTSGKIEEILNLYGMFGKTSKPAKLECETKEKDQKTNIIEQIFYDFFETNPPASSSSSSPEKDVEKECPDRNL